ncbi:MAG: hypothetical protein R3200_12130 [Xanthomonadales bacterium]|nr:hypothetical protein [Xanthomonadales bacterium]
MIEHRMKTFEYLLGRLSEQDSQQFELEILDDRDLQEDTFLSAMLIEMVKEYAVVCSQESFRKVL